MEAGRAYFFSDSGVLEPSPEVQTSPVPLPVRSLLHRKGSFFPAFVDILGKWTAFPESRCGNMTH